MDTPVYELEGLAKGWRQGKFAGTKKDATKLLFDKDFRNLDEAGKQFDELVEQAEKEGFKRITFGDLAEFDEKARASINEN